jgi:GNAT superfamily N-acetyltransferase
VALPPKLLDPAWQLALIATIITNASLALMGTLLLPLALGFDPSNHRLRARWHAFRRWALPAALGFLLLIPLQGYAAWRFQRTATVAQEQRTTQTSQQLFELRQAIKSATSHEELQTKLKQLFGRNAGLSPSELRMPMGELRNMLLARAEQHARDAGCKRIYLTTTNDNARAMRFYQRRGWRFAALHQGIVDRVRRIEPDYPLLGFDGIQIRDEIEFERWFEGD